MTIILLINLSKAHNIHQIPSNQQVGLHKDDLDHVRQLTRSIHEAQSPGMNYSRITSEAGMVMKIASGVISLSDRVLRRASEPSQTRVDNDGSVGAFPRIFARVLRVFSCREINRQRGEVGGRPGGPHHAQAWGSPRPDFVCLLDFCRVTVNICSLVFVPSNSENISCIGFLKPKTAENRNWHYGILLIC